MRAPKGHGKRYFTLSAIQAYAGALALQRGACSARAHHRMVSDEHDDDACVEEDDPLALESAAPELPGGRRRPCPCHCNRRFHLLACARLRSRRRPKRAQSPYRYARSALSPPPRRSSRRFAIHFPKESHVQALFFPRGRPAA